MTINIPDYTFTELLFSAADNRGLVDLSIEELHRIDLIKPNGDPDGTARLIRLEGVHYIGIQSEYCGDSCREYASVSAARDALIVIANENKPAEATA